MTSSGGVWGLRLLAATLLLSIGEANTGNWDWQRLYVYEEKEVTTIPEKIGTLPNKKFNKEKYMYLISGEGANTIFTLNDQGDIFVTSKLDREKKHVYHLNARLVERGNPQKDVEAPSDFKIYVQDINDNKPVFNGPYTGEIAEMSEIGTSVMTVSATDNDDPTTAHGRVRYTLLNGTDIFEINKDNGIITTKVNSLDRESTSEYIIMVQAKDMPGMTTGESSSATITINVKDVNDNLSTFKKGQYIFRVKEDVQVGSEMGTVEVEDKDEEQNKRPEFKIEDPDVNRLLEIKQNKNKNGMLLLRQPLDYESNSTYKFTLFVTEKTVSVPKVTPPLSKASIIIEVIDVDEPPRFSQKEYNITVDEEKYPVEFLGSVSAKDPDTINHPIRYSIEDSSCPVFIHPQNGRLSLRWKLDRELVTVHRCQVTATENVQNGLKGYAMLNLWVRDLNDNAPKLHTEDIYVCEADGPGTVVGILTASDKDETNGAFTFMLNKPSSNFSLSSNNNGTTMLKVKQGPFSTEDPGELVVEIKVHDGVHYSIETMRIRVCTCNDDRVLDYCRSSRQVGVSMHALITILLCIITILVIVILLVLRRRYQKESVALGKMSGEIHEQLVTYDEEGGGEMDTNGYDVSILTSARHDASLLPGPGLYAMVNKPQACKGDMAAMIEVKKDEADHDRDGYPYDTLHIYGYEGPGSLAGSLSSLGSSSSGDSLDYDFLNEWGPRFRTLAELYGVDGYPGDCPY